MLKQINGFDDYYVDDTGVVYSNKSGYLKPISQWKDGKGRYLLVHIVNNDGKAKNVLVHRIICEAFLPNPKDLPEVNHRRTGNRCQTCLPVGLKVIERVRGTQKHRPRLVQASIARGIIESVYYTKTINISQHFNQLMQLADLRQNSIMQAILC